MRTWSLRVGSLAGCLAAWAVACVAADAPVQARGDARAALADPCSSRGSSRGRANAVVVDTHARTLVLCAAGAAAGSFPVALGTGGLGKRREGDNRTPLGAYPLGPPRPSRQFGTFIPVGYPTALQARAGFTGGAVGIHGPPRVFAAAGTLNTAADWTAGCVAVGSDAEVERIAAWVRARRPVAVVIE